MTAAHRGRRPHPGGVPGSRRRRFEQEFADTAGKTPLVIKLLVAATFVVILNETIMINAIPRLMEDFEHHPRTPPSGSRPRSC